MKKGFTLAEVLITLGIIGIVAAMTLPALVHNYKKQEIEAKIKKFYTNMAQAVKLSEIDNGPAFYWSKMPELMMVMVILSAILQERLRFIILILQNI